MSRINNSERSSSSISHSKFGDHTRVHQGDKTTNKYYYSKIESDLDTEFLDALSSTDPSVERTAFEGQNGDLPEGAFDWVLDDENYKRWRIESGRPLLWIEDETGKGYTSLILRILDHLQEQDNTLTSSQPILSYFFCRPTEKVSKTISRVLEGLIYLLLSNNPSALSYIRKKYGPALRKTIEDSLRFYILSKVLQDVLKHDSLKEHRIYLVIDGLDQLITDDTNHGGGQIVDFVKPKAGYGSDVKWIISSRDRSSLYFGQHTNLMRVLTLTPEKLACSLGLSDSVDMIEKYGSQMEAAYQFFRSRCPTTTQSLEWFRYTTWGRSWLDRRSPLGSELASYPSLIWYYPERADGCPGRPSELGLLVSDIVNESEEQYEDCLDGYFSFRCFQATLDSSARAIYPGVALWSLFAHLAHKCCAKRDNLSSLLINLSRETRKVLMDICFKATDFREEPNLADFVDAAWIDMFDDSYLNPLIDLFQAIASLNTLARFLLVIDSFELVNMNRWAPCLQALYPLAVTGRARVFLSGGYLNELGVPSHGGIGLDMNMVNESTEYRDCLERLKFNELHSRRDQVAKALPGTNQWLWSNKAYCQWRSTGGFLWVSGKAGSGKSVLAKTIRFDFLRVTSKEQTADTWFVCDWFFNRRGHEIGMSHVSMLRTLIYEILYQHESTFNTVRACYRQIMEIAFHDLHFPGWSLEILKAMLHSLAVSPSTPKTLAIIDAWDESQTGHNRRQILELLFEITSGRKVGRLHLIVLSRPEPQILESFQGCLHIVMQDHNRDDIGQLVDAGLNSIRHAWLRHSPESANVSLGQDAENTEDNDLGNSQFSPRELTQGEVGSNKISAKILLPESEEAELERIRGYLLRYSEGVVLWVRLVLQQLRLQVQSLKGFSIKVLRKIVLDLPKELDDFYAHSIQSSGVLGEPERTEVTRRMLLWAVGSRSWEPLQLQDLLDAIAIPETVEPSTMSFEDPISLRRFQIGQNWNWFCHLIYQYCGPLVEVVESQNTTSENDFTWRVEKAQPTWTIQLLHQTVKSFLEDEKRSGPLCILERGANKFVLDESYKYLSIVLPKITTPYTPNIISSSYLRREIMKADLVAGPRVYEVRKLAELSRRKDRNEHNPEKAWIAWLDHFNNRPFLRCALRAVKEDMDNRGWVKDATLLLKDGRVFVNDSFPLWWAFDSYYPRDTIDQRDYLREFAKVACQHGEPVPVEILKCFMELLDATYAAKHGLIFRSTKEHPRSLVEGAVDAFIKSADMHPTCVFPISTFVQHRYGELDEELEEASHVAVRGKIKEDPAMLALVAVAERKLEDHRPQVAGLDPLVISEAIVYDKHCKNEQDAVGDKKMPVERLHNIVHMVLTFAEYIYIHRGPWIYPKYMEYRIAYNEGSWFKPDRGGPHWGGPPWTPKNYDLEVDLDFGEFLPPPDFNPLWPRAEQPNPPPFVLSGVGDWYGGT